MEIFPPVSLIIFVALLHMGNTETYEERARLELFQYDTELLDFTHRDNTVFVAVLIRNKEHALPYFFKAIEELDYDKKRMIIWISSDHNVDNSASIIKEWCNNVQHLYHKVQYEIDESITQYKNQKNDVDWTPERHKQVLQLRQKAIDDARNQWADYILFIDADNILMNPHTLHLLMDQQETIIAPMLQSTGAYSNFWCGMDENGYYIRTDDYFPIRNNEKNGTFEVPMIHSTMLIDLTKIESKLVQFWPLRRDYNFELDDIIVFAINCKNAGIKLVIDNSHVYGYLPFPTADGTLENDLQSFAHMVMEAFTEPPVGIGIYMKTSDYMTVDKKPKSKLEFEKVYMINLERRQDRRIRMKKSFKLLGIDHSQFNAIDSKTLNTSYLLKMGIDMLPGYVDPYKERALTRGEIGCFLSHYFIWQEVVANNYKEILLFEDDIRFENAFTYKLKAMMEDVKRLQLDWDLIYIGRKRMQLETPEKYISDWLVEADYSYWTLSYALSLSGAKKLLAGKPLGKMVPVDEYIPILSNKHPIKEYMESYPVNDLKVYSANPMLVYPTHYTGQINYFSDTETSSIWEEVENKAGTHADYTRKKNAGEKSLKTEL